MTFLDSHLFAVNYKYYDCTYTQSALHILIYLYNFNIQFYLQLHIYDIANVVFFFVKYLPEDGWNK
jgi:hypothetical protein